MATPQERSLYVISVAAELAGVHPQTLRIYERKGLVTPQRTSGNNRRYSESDIERLLRIQELTQEGLNLAGVMKVMALEHELNVMASRLDRAIAELERTERALKESIGAHEGTALVLHRDIKRIRRAMKSDVIEGATRRRIFAAPAISEEELQN
jgi:MerR family transcriptional regulator, heat shock protein HspR